MNVQLYNSPNRCYRFSWGYSDAILQAGGSGHGKAMEEDQSTGTSKNGLLRNFYIRITHVLDTMNVPTIFLLVGVKMKCYPHVFGAPTFRIQQRPVDSTPTTSTPSQVTSHQVVQVLLAWRGEVNGRDYDGETPLHLAVKLGDVELAGLLPWQTDSDGWEF